jgi:hypothetical protein
MYKSLNFSCIKKKNYYFIRFFSRNIFVLRLSRDIGAVFRIITVSCSYRLANYLGSLLHTWQLTGNT